MTKLGPELDESVFLTAKDAEDFAEERKGKLILCDLCEKLSGPLRFGSGQKIGILSFDTASKLLGYYHSSALRTNKPTFVQSASDVLDSALRS